MRGRRIRQTRFVNNETAPVLTRDGDLFVSVLIDGRWSVPRNLGPEANSRHSEFAGRVSPIGGRSYSLRHGQWRRGEKARLFHVWSLPVGSVPILVDALAEVGADS
ncbi:MAG: hypothetical protein WBA68_01080 [Alteraurantiacibacter sp.]